MAYLGNKPVNNFVSFAKQDITGNGGTSYSLDYPVTGANDIELFINNVRQEPTEAYSCSGSTLTLTGAVSSTDDVYVIFRGRALQTVGHPSDSALEAASADIDNGTFVVDATNNRVGIGNSAPASTLHIGTGYSTLQMGANDSTGFHWAKDTSALNLYTGANGAGTKRFGVDTSGRVTMPYQPAFTAVNAQSALKSNGDNLNFSATNTNVGNHFDISTSRFNVPVSGTYHFDFGVYCYTGNNPSFAVQRNGSQYSNADVAPNLYDSQRGYSRILTGSFVASATSGDYITLNVRVGGYSADVYGGHSWFSGHLIG